MTEIIYELRCYLNEDWHPFYVGHTTDPQRRLQDHRYKASRATDESTQVYRFINTVLIPNQIIWDLVVVDVLSEDQHIMDLLRDGVKLQNMKKGDPSWMERRQAEAQDMTRRGITNYAQYKEIISLEEQQQRTEARQRRWLDDVNYIGKPEDAPGQEHRDNVLNEMRRLGQTNITQATIKLLNKRARDDRSAITLKKIREQQEAEWLATGQLIGGKQ